MNTVHVIVAGTVQGVGFRASCLQEAQSRQVSGWVRNRDDGSVEAVFSGADDDVDALVGWCRSGPGSARVESVSVEQLDTGPPEDRPQGFTVR